MVITRSTLSQAELNRIAVDWRVIPAMWGVSNKRRAASPRSANNGLSGRGGSCEKNVDRGAGEKAGFKTCGERGFVDDAAARDLDYHRRSSPHAE